MVINDNNISTIFILLIETNAGSARLIEGLLQNAGDIDMEISWASRVEDGIRLAETKKFDLVLLDLEYNNALSVKILSDFYVKNTKLPIVVLTDKYDSKKYKQFIENGAIDLIVKGNMNSSELIKTIYFTVFRAKEKEHDDNIVVSLSYHVKSLLTSIKGSVDLIQKETFGKINSEQTELCLLASNNIKKMNSLIDDTVRFVTLSAGTYSMEFKNNNLKQVVKEAITFVRLDAENKDIEMVFDDKNNIQDCQFDHDSVLDLILSLLTNAIKFTKKGSIKIDCFEENRKACLSVKDTGIGIRKKDTKRIFEPFQLISLDEDMSQFSGTGLGLSVAKLITRLHGGELEVKSIYGKGAEFILCLPLGRSSKE
ncbi:MAG: hybrid sensor histidine kinase/response regulator [Caldisericia bacterium]|nr:hybrid sensor histidine kinase/response regulator [Caldisericia bacterium]